MKSGFTNWGVLLLGAWLGGCGDPAPGDEGETGDDGTSEDASSTGAETDGSSSASSSSGGDGDSTTTGDGDGDSTTAGDGDGDSSTTGDGDGDSTSSGDGDGDGDAALPCDTAFDYKGFAGCESVIEGLSVKFFPLPEGTHVERLAIYFHGDTGNGWFGNWGFDEDILTWAQARNILVLGVLSPATYDDDTIAWGAAQVEHANAVAPVFETFLETYAPSEAVSLYWGVSGGSWFLTASYIASVGHRVPGIFVANCGGAGNSWGWAWDPSTETELRDSMAVYFNYGTLDFLAAKSAASLVDFTSRGFTTDELVHQGAEHCDHPIAEPTIDFWGRHQD